MESNPMVKVLSSPQECPREGIQTDSEADKVNHFNAKPFALLAVKWLSSFRLG